MATSANAAALKTGAARTDGAVSPAKFTKQEEGSHAGAGVTLGVAATEDSLVTALGASPCAKAAEQKFPIWKDKFPITEVQIKTARELIKALAEAGLSDLLNDTFQKSLKEKGNTLDKVHPLCLLWALFSHADTKIKLAILREKSVTPVTTVWDTLLGYSSLVAEDKDSGKKGYGLSLEKFYGGKALQEVKNDFDAFYGALRLDPDVMDPLLEEALKTVPEIEAPQEASGWGFGALVASAKKVVATALSVGAWDSFLRELLKESSYIKLKKD